MGPTGPCETLGPTSYDAVCFSSFKDTNSAGTSTITTTRIIPGNSDIISITGNKINILRTNVFEITLCGRISGVTNNTGGKFYLYNTATGEKISDMEFVFDKGNTSDMDFSEVNFADIYTGGSLEVRTEIIGNDTGNISFSSNGGLVLNNPKRFVLYNEKANVINTSSNISFDFEFSRVNLLDKVISIDSVISSSNMSLYSWYKEKGNSSIKTFNSSTCTIESHNFTNDELSILPSLSNFVFF